METTKFKIIAVIAAVATALIVFYYLKRIEASRPVQTTVIEAVQDIPSGTQILPGMVQETTVYETDVIPSAVTTTDDVVGMYASASMYAGEQISSKKVTDQSASSSAASFSYKIPKGMRTVTIAIDPTTSVAGMLQVGDHVDIIATYQKAVTDRDGSDGDLSSGSETVTRFIADNIEVAALDQTIVRSEGSSEDGKDSSEQTYTTVTLFVTPDLAKALVYENATGSLVFTLRSPDETENPDHEEFTARSMEEF